MKIKNFFLYESSQDEDLNENSLCVMYTESVPISVASNKDPIIMILYNLLENAN